MKKLLSITLALVLCACGGGGGDKKSPPVSEKPVLTGVLIDSPVGNIAYRSETRNGFTSNEGKFRYLAGEMVVFFIGDLEFPAVKGASVITPWDIVSGTTATDITTRNNILRLLQTLDNDGNPDNGIFIYPEAAAAFQDITYTIDSPTFEADVAADLNEISPGLTLVTEADANAHFATTMKKNLLGSWVLAYGSARSVITFIDESRYIVIHEHENVDDLQEEGTVEYGEYSWDPLTGRFDVLAVLDESDGSGGLYGSADDEPPASQTLTLSGDTLKLVKENGTFSVSRVINASNPLVGAWLYSTVDTDDINVLTFLSATDYVLAHTRNDGVYQNREPRTSRPLSGEFGRYSLDGEDFSVLAAHIDSDGDGGLFNAEAESPQANTGKQLQLESGNMLVLIDDGEPGYFSRIGYGGYAVDEGIVFADYFHAGEIGDTWQFNNDWDFGLSAATKFPGFYQREAGDMFYKVNQDKSLSFVFGDAETGEIYTGWSFDMAARIDEGVIYQAMPGEQCVLTRLNEISVQAGVFIDVVREVCVDEESPVNQENAVYAPYSDFGVSSVIWYARGVGPVKYLITHYADDLPNDLAELVSTTVVP